MSSVSQVSSLTDRTLARQKYPNPFFDLSKVYMPKGIKSILKFCRMFFYRNEFIHSVLHKMTEYPITPLLFENLEDHGLVTKWQTILYHHLKIKTFLIEVGLDYHVFGNCFISAVQKFRRQLRCTACQELTDVADFKSKTLKFSSYRYMGICPHCMNNNVEFKIEDISINEPQAIKFVRWAPELIDINYDPFTGDREYFYNLDQTTKRAVNSGNLDKINKIPKIFIDSMKQNKKIKIDPNNLYHLKRPDISEEDMSWGKPTILPAMSLIWYMQTLRRGNEAIALEHVVPMRAIYPASTGDVNPLLQMNLAGWKSRVQEEMDNYRNDPNYIGIFPIPLGYQSLGGDAKALLLTPELRFLEETIINSLGVPVEFIKGGTTWTGSSISLRIVENGFLSYREHLEDLLNYFIIPKIVGMLQYGSIKVRFKRFRMSDDTETKNLAIQLNQMGKLADSLLMQEFGFDQTENLNTMKTDLDQQALMDKKRAGVQAAVNNIVAIEQMRGQAQAESAYMEEKSIMSEEMFADEIASEAGSWMDNLDTSSFMRKLTAQLMGVDPQQQAMYLAKLQMRMPTIASLLAQRLQLTNESMMQAMPQTVQAQQQQQEMEMKDEVSARRASGRTSTPKKPVVSKTTKHTASKRGEPK